MATLLQSKNNCMKSLINGTVSGGGTQQQQQQPLASTSASIILSGNNVATTIQDQGITSELSTKNPTQLYTTQQSTNRMLLPHEMVHSIQSVSTAIIGNMTSGLVSGIQGTIANNSFTGHHNHYNNNQLQQHPQFIGTHNLHQHNHNFNHHNQNINIHNHSSNTNSHNTVINNSQHNHQHHNQYIRYFSQFSNNYNNSNNSNNNRSSSNNITSNFNNSQTILTNSTNAASNISVATTSAVASTAVPGGSIVNSAHYLKHDNNYQRHFHLQQNPTLLSNSTLTTQSHQNAYGSNNNNINNYNGNISNNQQNGGNTIMGGTENSGSIAEPIVSSSGIECAEAEVEPEPEIDIVINNVVCSFSVRCHLNLRDIALNGFNVEFRRENGMVTMKLRRPYTTASIWSSGRITCTGATSELQAKIAARRYARCLQKLGFNVRFNNFRVVNVLGTCSMPWAIKIVNFSEKFKKDASYEPELHPGVTYKLKYPKATLKIFSTGSITVTAASVAHVQNAIEYIFPLVYEFRKKRSPADLDFLRGKQEAASAKQAAALQGDRDQHSGKLAKLKENQKQQQEENAEQIEGSIMNKNTLNAASGTTSKFSKKSTNSKTDDIIILSDEDNDNHVAISDDEDL